MTELLHQPPKAALPPDQERNVMLHRLWENKRQEGGFSLIELLVVIVILGILAGVVVFAVGGIQDKGQTSACKADYKTIQTAEEAYYANFDGSYADMATLVSKKLLSQASEYYTVTGGDTYSIAVATTGDHAGDCTLPSSS